MQEIYFKTQAMVKTPGIKLDRARNGWYQEFNKYATLVAEGLFVNDRKNGVWKEYYDHTGTLMLEENYRDGIQHGRFASYHPNGQLLSEGEFNNGLRVGYFKIYDEKGNPSRKLLFINNNQIEDQILNQTVNEDS